jgi:hypothetical protein
MPSKIEDPDQKRSVRIQVWLSPVEALRLERIRRNLTPPPTSSSLTQYIILEWIKAQERKK